MNAELNKDELNKEIHLNFKRNTALSFLDGGLYAFGSSMVPIGTVLLYYLSNFVSSKTLLGFSNCVYSLLFFTPQLLIAKRIERLRYYKGLFLWLGLLVRICWLFFGIATFMFAKTNKILYVIIFYIILSFNGLTAGFMSTAWLSFIVRIVPSEKLSDFFSWRAAFSGSMETLGALASGAILSLYSFPDNYGILFIIIFCVMMVSLGMAYFQTEPKNMPLKERIPDSGSYWKERFLILKKDKSLMNYLLSTTAIGGFGKMSIVFQIIHANEKLSLSPQEVAMTSMVLFLAQVVGYIFWGYVIKKKGLKFVGAMSSALFLPAILLTLWMPNMFVLYLAVILMSLAQSFRNSNENNVLINLTPDESLVPSYIGLRNFFVGPFFALTPVIAGYILDISNFFILTLLSFIVMSFGVIMFFFIKLERDC